MRILKKSYDGGPDSGVTGYWFVESKNLFSIVLLHFSPGSREAYHNHAFNAVTWWLKGTVIEEFYNKRSVNIWKPSIKPKYTSRKDFHKVIAGQDGAWALSFRGRWHDTWKESKLGQIFVLTHGREIIE